MRALAVLLLRPGGFFGDWSDFNYYREMAQLSDQGYLPYIHYWAEYPPLLPWLAVAIHRVSLLLPQWVHPMLWFQLGLSAVTIAAETGTLLLVRRIGARLWGIPAGDRCAWLYGALFLPFYGVMLWFDSIPVFFLLLGLEALLARRPLLAGLACGAGFVGKLFPLVLAPVIARDSPRVRPIALFALGAAAVIALAFGPLYIISRTMTLASVTGMLSRQAWETVWALVDGYYGTGGVASLADRLFYPASASWSAESRLPWSAITALFGAAYAGAWWLAFLESRRHGADQSEPARARSLVALTALTLALLVLYSRGFSQQFTLWLLPLVVVLAPTTRGTLFALALIACNTLVEGYLWVNVFPQDRWLLRATVLVRTALIAALAVEAASQLFPSLGRIWSRLKLVAVPAFAAAVGVIALVMGLRLWPAYWRDTLARSPSAGVVAAVRLADATTPVVFLDRDAYTQAYAYLTPRPMLLVADAKLPERVGTASLHARLAGLVGSAQAVVLVAPADPRTDPLAPAVRAWLERSFAETSRAAAGGREIVTRRMDDVLAAVADAAGGTLVAAETGDQATAVREFLRARQRADVEESRATELVPRAWLPLLVAALVLLAVTVRSPGGALVGLLLALAGARAAEAQRPAAGERRLASGDAATAASAYLDAARRGTARDTAFYNAGTAALAAGRRDVAAEALEAALASRDPEVRYRALYNAGLILLQQARDADGPRRDSLLDRAAERFRESLLLAPGSLRAKWNLELATRDRPPPPPPRSGGSGGGGGGSANPQPDRPPPPGGLSRGEAEQILNSIEREERETRESQLRRRRFRPRGVRDW